MNLEDHLGDIVRKARAMSDISLSAAARVAGLTEPELTRLEESGVAPQSVHWASLSELINLSPIKLKAIADGWQPNEPDLKQWCELRVITTNSGETAVNCYLVWDEITREGALFDTGWQAEPICKLIAENELQLKHILITHGHEDHIAALGALRQQFPKARLHANSKHAPVDQRLRLHEFIHLGSLRITYRETPGHAEDGVTYIVGNWPEDAPHVAMVGDAIFAGSIGRGNQSWVIARQKVREQIFSLPNETLLCPGHGPLTTVAQEKEHNPFF